MNYNQCLVLVRTMYYENYGSVDSVHWKPKGVREFKVVMDVDNMFYMRDKVEEMFRVMCDRMRDDFYNFYRFDYTSYEVFFEEPTDVTEKFNQLWNEKIKVGN